MAVELIIICYRLYFLGLAILMVNNVARLVFGEASFKNTLRAIFAAFFWPLFAFSKRGRRKLLARIKKM